MECGTRYLGRVLSCRLLNPKLLLRQLGTCPYVDLLLFFLASFSAFFLSFLSALLPFGDVWPLVFNRCA